MKLMSYKTGAGSLIISFFTTHTFVCPLKDTTNSAYRHFSKLRLSMAGTVVCPLNDAANSAYRHSSKLQLSMASLNVG